MGCSPRATGLQPVSNNEVRGTFESAWRHIDPEPVTVYRICLRKRSLAGLKACTVRVRISPADPNTQHVEAALSSMECLIVQDIFLNETAKFAHVFLPDHRFSRRMERSRMLNEGSLEFARRWSRLVVKLTGRRHWASTGARLRLGL